MTAMDYAELAGTALPGSTFVVSEADDERFSSIVAGQRAGDDTVDPMWAFVGALGGAGLSIAQLFELVDCPMEDGPMLGAVDLEFDRPLRADRPYRIDASVLDVERKRGRSGTFDLLRVTATLTEDAGAAATCTTTYVIPRRAGA